MSTGIEFRATTHQYFHERRELIAVTAAFEKIGITDFSKVPFDVLEPARILGDRVHEMALYFGHAVLDESQLDAQLLPYLEATKKYFRDRVKRVISLETPVFDLSHGYAGTPDIVYEDFEDALCLDDYKTPIKLHPACKWQTAAYAYAFQKNYKGLKIDKRHAVQLRKDGEYHLDHHSNPLMRDFDEFVTILRAAYLKIRNKIK